MKFRTYIKVAKHNMKLQKVRFAFSPAKHLAKCSLLNDIFFTEDTQHREASGTVINGGKFARIF